MRGSGWSFAAQRSLDRNLTTFSEHYLYAQRRDLNGGFGFLWWSFGVFSWKKKTKKKSKRGAGRGSVRNGSLAHKILIFFSFIAPKLKVSLNAIQNIFCFI